MKKILLSLIAIISFAFTSPLIALPAYAACPDSNTARGQALQGVGATGNDCDTGGVTNLISTIVNILSIIVGIAAIIVIIISGLKYITSGGASDKVSSAKNTLIYAVIGLVIAALAQLLVHFVLNQSNNAVLPTCTKSQSPAHDNCVNR